MEIPVIIRLESNVDNERTVTKNETRSVFYSFLVTVTLIIRTKMHLDFICSDLLVPRHANKDKESVSLGTKCKDRNR